MIVRIAHDTASIAFRVRGAPDWRHLGLQIVPARRHCREWGSPWFLHGCWPKPWKKTDVDIAHPTRLDSIPSLVYECFGIDDEGRYVFRTDTRLLQIPSGRYTGLLVRRAPSDVPPDALPLDPPGHPCFEVLAEFDVDLFAQAAVITQVASDSVEAPCEV